MKTICCSLDAVVAASVDCVTIILPSAVEEIKTGHHLEKVSVTEWT